MKTCLIVPHQKNLPTMGKGNFLEELADFFSSSSLLATTAS
jgi:hypothetical protein